MPENAEETPAWQQLWQKVVETFLSTLYFLIIAGFAVAIDLTLHWFEHQSVVARYGLSPIIRWEIELMAYTLATVDCFLFTRKLIQPIVEFVARALKK